MSGVAGKLGLGTVQLGMSYGISNTSGRTAEAAVRPLLEYAWSAGISVLDTASAYGESETVLGRHLPRQHQFALITKTVPLPEGMAGADLRPVERAFRESLGRLGVATLHAVLVHRASDLLGSAGSSLYALLRGWQRAGLVRKIGASVYDPTELQQVTGRYALDLVQLPLSVFDQRAALDGSLRALKASGVEVHARSVFLQGLLLMRPEELPAPRRACAARIAAYRDHLAQLGLSPLEGALAYVKQLHEVDVAVIGVNSLQQLRECVSCYERVGQLQLAQFAVDDPAIIDPRRWGAA